MTNRKAKADNPLIPIQFSRQMRHLLFGGAKICSGHFAAAHESPIYSCQLQLMETRLQKLKSKLVNRSALVVVVGQGYVGLPLALRVVQSGFNCVGLDTSSQRVAGLNAGNSHILDVSDAELGEILKTNKYRASEDYREINNADVVSICVPTPLRKTRDPDVSYIQSSVASMKPNLNREGVLIILESTTYPGTTKEIVAEALEGEGLVLDENLFVAFSPERVDPGNEIYGLKNTPKVVGGVTDKSTELIAQFYREVVDNVHVVPTAREAEMVKLLENTFRAVNIALVNEMMLMSDRMGIDIWEVIEAAGTKPFGFMKFTPGPGIGGHCIPLDPTYLSWKAKSYGFYNRFIELATDINGNMPRFVVQKLVRCLNDRGTTLRGAKVLILGMAYKPDINDLRESPGLDVWQLLEQEWGAEVRYHDPFIDRIVEFNATSVDLTDEEVSSSDAVVIITDHSTVNYGRIADIANVVLDTRRAAPPGPNVVRL